jgi:hypothetical protein
MVGLDSTHLYSVGGRANLHLQATDGYPEDTDNTMIILTQNSQL